MDRQVVLQKGVILIPGLFIAATVIGITYYRMENAKKELAIYWLAKSCPSPENCRSKVAVTILKGEEKTVTIKNITRYGNTSTYKNTSYFVSLLLLNTDTQSIEISSAPPSTGTAFDIPNVHVPSGADSHFVEENFYQDEPAYVETWHKTITLLYLDVLIDNPDRLLGPSPLSVPQPATITGSSLPRTYEIALPTTLHPLFLQASAEYNFRATIVICSVLIVLFLFALFNEEINEAWQRKSSAKLLSGPKRMRT